MCYESRKLNECEYNYVTHDLKLEVIIHALNMWRNYLLGKRFVFMSTHSGLRYLFNQPKMNSMQAIWLDTLNEFYFDIKYIKGRENRVVNAIIRRV